MKRRPSKSYNYYRGRVARDMVIIVCAALVLALLAQLGVLAYILAPLRGMWQLSAFIAGIFFTSGFTILPATFALAEISREIPLPQLILWGASGAVIGDLVLFYFVRDIFSADVWGVIRASRFAHYLRAPKVGFLHWVIPVIGGLIVASPLPDELGLMMMGASKVKARFTVPLLFIMNCFGVWAVALAAAAFR